MSDFYRLSCPETGELLELRGRTFILGRSSDCDLQVAVPEASRQHLALEIADGVLYVEDLRSANGTFVNGHRCRARHALKSRDILGVARVEYMVLGPGESSDLTMISHQPSREHSSYVTDEQDGDMTLIVGRYPLPPDWPDDVESEIPANSLRGMERELERRLIRDRLMAGELVAAFWIRQPGADEDQLLKVFPADEQTWIMGRANRCDLMLADFSVSSTHARLEYSRAGWKLSDLDSSNGTAINGVSVEQRSPLVSGDIVSLGSVELIFRSLLKR